MKNGTLSDQLTPICKTVEGIKSETDTCAKSKPSPDSPSSQGYADCCQVLQQVNQKLPGALVIKGNADHDWAATTSGDIEAAKKASDSSQHSLFGTDNSTKNIGATAKAAQSQNSAAASKLLSNCAETTKKACDSYATDPVNQNQSLARAYRLVHDKCTSFASSTGALAAQEKADSMSLGDLAKTAAASAQLLGAAAQLAGMMNKGGKGGADPNSGMSGEAGATSPTPSSINSSSTAPETSSLNDNSKTGASTVGLGAPPSGAKTGSSQTAAADAGNSSWSKSTSWETSSGGGPVAGSGGTFMPGSGGSGGSARSGDSSGASRLADFGRDPASTAKTNTASLHPDTMEIGGAGGVSNRAMMMGIKPGSGDLADATNGALPAADPALEGLGASGASNMAPDGSRGSAAEPEDPDSIFLRIRTKYAGLAKKGRF